MLEGGVIPSQLDNENYLEILEVMKAKPRGERPLNPNDAHKKLMQMLGG